MVTKPYRLKPFSGRGLAPACFSSFRCTSFLNSGFYVSDVILTDPLRIKEHYGSPVIEVKRDEPGQQIDLYTGNYKIGKYFNGSDMVVSIIGNGAQKGVFPIRGVSLKAMFFIGGLHGGETGGINAINVMKDYMQKQPYDILSETNIFILNPASNEIRDINGKDPNRNFRQLSLPEIQAITQFLEFLKRQYLIEIVIISGHQWNDSPGRNLNGRIRGEGYVLPLYLLTSVGEAKVGEPKDDNHAEISVTRGDYTIPEISGGLAWTLHGMTGFIYADLWLNTVYPGELMNYVNKMGARVHMVEFEIPFSKRTLPAEWRSGFISFIQSLLGVPQG